MASKADSEEAGPEDEVQSVPRLPGEQESRQGPGRGDPAGKLGGPGLLAPFLRCQPPAGTCNPSFQALLTGPQRSSPPLPPAPRGQICLSLHQVPRLSAIRRLLCVSPRRALSRATSVYSMPGTGPGTQ